MNKITKGLALGGAVVASVAIGAIGHELIEQPEIEYINETVYVNNTEVIEVPVPVIEYVNQTVTEIEYVENVSVQTALCDRLVYDDVSECVEEVNAEDAALALAIEEIRAEAADLLDDEGLIKDEDDFEIVRVYDDFEDIDVKESDFDDEEYKFVIEAKVEDTKADKKFKVAFTVEVEDSEAEIKKVVKV